ncbi:MAG: cytochrome c biogenesis protein CcdA [Candidatus Omnitrophota bacterium]
MTESVSLPLAFFAGVLSFLSPCVLPLVPSYLSYITGLSVETLASGEGRRTDWQHIGIHAALFILGFSCVFMILGMTASVLGQFVAHYHKAARQGGGVLVFLFGAYLAGLLKIRFLSRERRFAFPVHPAGYAGSFLVGVIFSFAWTPCVGPILGSILVLAGSSESLHNGLFLLGIYALGLGIPFFLSALALNFFLTSYRKIRPYLGALEVASGVVLMALGVLLVTNTVVRLAGFCARALLPLSRLLGL